jgi:Ring finger domain
VSSRNLSDIDQASPGDKETVETQSDDGESNFLFLIGNHLNASRHVPAYCIICFCAYEIGDPVSFSSNINCCHAFHKECIESWLIKEPQSLCPCCRNEFCEATTKLEPTSMAQEI